ncbi:MAG: peptide deformylase [Candidatus Delongbacteria bacterium]|nr:peptide deformylase [Candidatus Delongbacteria bacterium]MBN2835088.1 peptide deformylase [Candidatus Delongbacteria bacterium]
MKNEVLLLGNPILRLVSDCVIFPLDEKTKLEIAMLHEALEEFRCKVGFGRGIAAPQIGISKRIIALNLKNKLYTVINPNVVFSSNDKFFIWDDCMSFPDLLVKVERHKSISMVFLDENGEKIVWENLPTDVSELMQHEIDHLDGILAVDRVVDKFGLIYKSELNKATQNS